MMKNIIIKKFKSIFISGLIVLSIGCERDIADDAPDALFSSNGEVFTDIPVGLTDQFFESFNPAEGYNTDDTFEVVDDESFDGTSSIRIDVPSPDNPNGFLAGGIFRDRGEGRNLTGYDALTFWAKASTTATLASVGFGSDFEEDKFAVTRSNLQLTTNWTKYIIPIPDPSKLVQERGLFSYIAAPFDVLGDGPNGNEIGWTMWIDEIRFETLGTLGQPRPGIFNGSDIVTEAFTGSNIQVTPLTYTVNQPSGLNATVNATANYFEFESSDPAVASVDSTGEITVLGDGTTTITASIGNIAAEGSIEVTSIGPFPHAPVPTRDPANVISLFSDAYTNVPVRHYNGFFLPFQTTQGGAGSDPNNVDIQAPFSDGSPDNIINYTALNFVSIGTYETVPLVDVSSMTTIHMDINVREAIDGGDFIRILIEAGTGAGATSAGDFTLNAAALSNVNADGWATIDIPLSSFSGSIDFANLGQVFFISDATVSDIWVDNVYFHND